MVNSGRVEGWFEGMPTLLNALWLVAIALVNSGRIGGWFEGMPTLLKCTYWLVAIAPVNPGRVGSWFQGMPTLQNPYYTMRSRSGDLRVAWPFGQGASH